MKLMLCNLSRKASFISMITLTSSFFLVEIIVGYVTNSMALVADSFHMLSDVASLLVGFLALRYSKIGRKSNRYTFGWARAEVLGALVNAVFLVALCFSILVEALKRMVVPESIENIKLVLFVGLAGLIVNIIGLGLFHQHGHGHSHGHRHSHGGHGHDKGEEEEQEDIDHPEVIYSTSGGLSTKQKSNGITSITTSAETEEPLLVADEETVVTTKFRSKDQVEATLVFKESLNEANDSGKPKKQPKPSNQLNMRGVYLHVLGDALGSVIVMISALIIMFTSGKWTLYVDPSLSIIMVIIILKTSIPLLKESSMILMQTVPTHLKIQEIQEKLVDQVSGVLSIHEFHVWQLAGNKIIASAHVKCRNVQDYMGIANELKEFFHNEGIHSTTIQPEFEEQVSSQNNSLADCILDCGLEKNCVEQRCCKPSETPSENLKRRTNGSAQNSDNKSTSSRAEDQALVIDPPV